MQTRREQVRAHSFVVRRLVRGILLARPDDAEQPFRRSATGTLIGTILALLILAGAAVLGFVRPGAGPALADTTNVVVEKETGTRYVVDSGTLRPVANLASVLLLAGPDVVPQTLTRKRTALLPRSAAVGIVGAPDDVPTADAVTASGWSVCIDATTATTGLAPTTLVSFAPSDRPTPLQPGQGFLVAADDGSLYLVHDGRRFRIASTQARNALGYAANVPLRAGSAWLSSLRPGRTVNVLSVDGAGQAGPSTDAGPTLVGQVLAVHQVQGIRYFLVQRGGIVPVTEFEALLLMGNPKLSGLYPDGRIPVVVPQTAIATATRTLLPDSLGWPDRPVAPVVPGRGSVCSAAAADGVPWLGLGARAAADSAADPTDPDAAPRSGGLVVRVPPGSGVVVRETNASGGEASAVDFVDDTGRRFRVDGEDALGALGLLTAPRVAMPVGLLDALPGGPVLSVEAAGRPVPAAGASSSGTGTDGATSTASPAVSSD